MVQAYCYVPDWARAAVALAEIRAALQTFEDVPFAGHSFSVEQFRAFASGELGRSLKLADFPWWAMTMTAPFWELAREMLEMRYLWSVPHTLCGEKLARLVPELRPTPLDVVLRTALRAAGALVSDGAMGATNTPLGVAELTASGVPRRSAVPARPS